MKPAVIITDMVNDFIKLDGPLPVGEEGLKIIPQTAKINQRLPWKNIPIIYANDALLPNDFCLIHAWNHTESGAQLG